MKFICKILFALAFISTILTKEELAAASYQLSQAQLEIFENEGFLILQNFLTEEEVSEGLCCAINLCERAKEMARSLCETEKQEKIFQDESHFVVSKKNDGEPIVHRILWAKGAKPELGKISQKPELLQAIAQLLEADTADHLVNQIHYKLPRDGVEFGIHQDIQSRRMYDADWRDVNGKGSFIQTIIALDPMTSENGPIHYVPLNLYGKQDLRLEDEYDPKPGLCLDSSSKEKVLSKIRKSCDIGESDTIPMIPITLNSGDLLIMGPYLIHVSFTNTSEMSRTILINGFASTGASPNAKDVYTGGAKAINLSGGSLID